MINYFPEDIKYRGDFFTCLLGGISFVTGHIYTFGAPGHGKGPWDGIGGRWKAKIDQCSSSSETQGRLSYTESGYIQSTTDVVMALRYHFERGDQRDVQLAGKNPVHGYQSSTTPMTIIQFSVLWRHSRHLMGSQIIINLLYKGKFVFTCAFVRAGAFAVGAS